MAACGIFISYRRADLPHAAGRLADALGEAFGDEQIFRDIETIEAGVDFSRALEQALSSCAVLLALIGGKWLDLRDAQGQRRLDQPDDWTRLEIATALRRDIRVVPVLLEGAHMPEEAELPEDLKPLRRRQAVELSDARWRGDVQRLVEALAKVPGLKLRQPPAPPPPGPEPPKTRRIPKWAYWVAGAAGVLGLLAENMDGDLPNAVPPMQPLLPDTAPGTAVGGLWHTDDGTALLITQHDASRFSFVAQYNGVPSGAGSGVVHGNLMQMGFQGRLVDGRLVNGQCNLQGQAGAQAYIGACTTNLGPQPLRLFR